MTVNGTSFENLSGLFIGIKIPSIGWGGWRGNPSGPSSTSFRESVVEPTRAGDLTYSRADIRIFADRLAKLQLRDSAGLTPASPLTGLFSCCLYCMPQIIGSQ